MGLVHIVNTCEIPLMLRQIAEEVSEIARAREHLARQRREFFMLDVLSVLQESREAAA
jgi:hypothetical protein